MPRIPVARTTTRKSAKPAKARLTTRSTPVAVTIPIYSPNQAVCVGRFVRRSATRIAAEIADASAEMEGLLLVVDGSEEAGLHDLRIALALHNSIYNLG